MTVASKINCVDFTFHTCSKTFYVFAHGTDSIGVEVDICYTDKDFVKNFDDCG